MGNKESVMAQAEIDIQDPAPAQDEGRRRGRALLPAGNLQIFKILRQQPGKVEPGGEPARLGFGNRNILRR